MDDFYGVPPTMSFAGNTSYPPSSLVYDGIHPYYSHHQSRYSTPAPEDDFLSYGSSPGYPGPSPGLSIVSPIHPKKPQSALIVFSGELYLRLPYPNQGLWRFFKKHQ